MDKLTQAHITFVNTSTATQSNAELRVSLRANRAKVATISTPSSGAKTEVQYERISIVTENELMIVSGVHMVFQHDCWLCVCPLVNMLTQQPHMQTPFTTEQERSGQYYLLPY